MDYQWTPELLGERREREKSGWERYREIETAGERERESWFVPRVFFCFRVFLLLFEGFSLRGVRSRCCGDILWIFFENWSVVIQVHLFFKEKNRLLFWFLGEYIRCFCCVFTFYIMLLFYDVYLHCLFMKFRMALFLSQGQYCLFLFLTCYTVFFLNYSERHCILYYICIYWLLKLFLSDRCTHDMQ